MYCVSFEPVFTGVIWEQWRVQGEEVEGKRRPRLNLPGGYRIDFGNIGLPKIFQGEGEK